LKTYGITTIQNHNFKREVKMNKSIFEISKMDCSAEEQMVRMKLKDVDSIHQLEFNLPERTLIVSHSDDNDIITHKINELNLDSNLIRSEKLDIDEEELVEDDSLQTKLLWAVLIINFGFFVIEMTTGILSRSMELVADSLDMFANAAALRLRECSGCSLRRTPKNGLPFRLCCHFSWGHTSD
jgi:cation transport ATPase